MSFEADLADLMPHTVTIAPRSSQDEYGAPTYGTAVSYSARVVEKATRYVDVEGRENVASTVVWGRGHASTGIPNVGPEARLTLPDGSTPAIVSFEVYPDDGGDHHFKIVCDRARRMV